MIIGITGAQGSGKTLLTSMFAYRYFSKRDSEIFANYELNFDHKPLCMKDIENADFDFNNSVLAVDEIHLFLDSRTSGTKKNRLISYFITQSRKRNIIFIYTTQHAHQVDKRLRSNTDYIIQCRNLSPKDAKKDITIQWTIHDMEGHKSKHLFKADPFFKLYITRQIIDFTK